MDVIIERILKKIQINENECWEWQASTNPEGYGRIRVDYVLQYPHRIMFEYYYGSICPDLTIDHLCRNPSCCNPLHLEQVTMKVNNFRGSSPPSLNAKKEYCPNGHTLSDDNLYQRPNGWRECRTCRTEKFRRYNLQKRKISI